MITLDVTTDNQSGLAGMISGLTAQLPFAYAVAINDTVNQSQTAIQRSLAADFTLRRAPFIVDTIYRGRGDFATKSNLVGIVRVNPARDVLAKFESDTTKRPTSGKALAVPIIRADMPSLIIGRDNPLAIKNVMSIIKDQGGKLARVSAPAGWTRKDAKAAAKAKAHNQQSFFLMTAKNGRTLILQRTGPDSIRVLYSFMPTVPIESHRLHFDEIAMKTALERWQPNFDRALEFAIASMR